MNRNGIIRPDAMNVETTYAAGPLAHPVPIVITTADGAKVLALGGLTKVEVLAGQIATGYYGSHGEDDHVAAAKNCVDLAVAILAECERRRKPPEETT